MSTHKIPKYNTENTNPITLDGEDVESFTYLESIIEEQVGSDMDVKATIVKARTVFLQLNDISNTKQRSPSQNQNLKYERQDSSTLWS